MLTVCILLSALWILYLLAESARARRDRKALKHVIHVNGTRGKTTTCRLIEAGLRAGGFKVFCKTTGTDPLVIDVNGKEELLTRRGKANIKEQIGLLHRAAGQGAEILVIECMALQPELQAVSQHRILKADIGVLTNVRRDHTDVMGETSEEICDVLCSTVPSNGVFFTGEALLSDRIRSVCEEMHTVFHSALPTGCEPDFDFPENIALALAICKSLGVSEETALAGMKNYRRDPFALSVYLLNLPAGSTAAEARPQIQDHPVLINALSVNDIESTRRILEDTVRRFDLTERKLILLLNNRADRGSRTEDMARLAGSLAPEEIWLLGSNRSFLKKKLTGSLPGCRILDYPSAADLNLCVPSPDTLLLAAGNLAGEGRLLDKRIREEGFRLV